MPQKIIHVDGVGPVPFYKRRGSSSVRIRINGSDVKVTMPSWMPYKAAVLYVSQKSAWIASNRVAKAVLRNGNRIGKSHYLELVRGSGSRYSSSQTSEKLTVRIPIDADPASTAVQKKITQYAQKSLQVQAEELILPRVRSFAANHGFIVNAIEIKNLKSRWGSCSNKQDLAFSLFLIQLPWECIDYVIYHELAHTVHLNHSKDFWLLVQQYVPRYNEIRKAMKQYAPHVIVS